MNIKCAEYRIFFVQKYNYKLRNINCPKYQQTNPKNEQEKLQYIHFILYIYLNTNSAQNTK